MNFPLRIKITDPTDVNDYFNTDTHIKTPSKAWELDCTIYDTETRSIQQVHFHAVHKVLSENFVPVGSVGYFKRRRLSHEDIEYLKTLQVEIDKILDAEGEFDKDV